MKKDRDITQMLFCNNPYQDHYYGPEWDRLPADFKTKHRLLEGELQRLREDAEWELQRSISELVSRRLYRSGLVKTEKTYLHEKKDALTSCNLHHREEPELERALLLCHLQRVYEKLLLQRHGRCSADEILKKQVFTKSQTRRNQMFSSVKTTELYFKSISKSTGLKEQQHSSGWALCAAGPCTTACGDTCLCSSLRICHPQALPMWAVTALDPLGLTGHCPSNT